MIRTPRQLERALRFITRSPENATHVRVFYALQENGYTAVQDRSHELNRILEKEVLNDSRIRHATA